MKIFLIIIVGTFLIMGCSADRGAWTQLDSRMGVPSPKQGQTDKEVFLEHWGTPRSAVRTEGDSEEFEGQLERLTWLWKADDSGLSDEKNKGWEIFGFFDVRGHLQKIEIGIYQVPYTLTEIMQVIRKHKYTNELGILDELGFWGSQHSMRTNATMTNWERLQVGNLGYSHREGALIRVQRNIKVISQATLISDTITKNLYDRLATESEMLEGLKAEAKRRQKSSRPTHIPHRLQIPGSLESGVGLLPR